MICKDNVFDEDTAKIVQEIDSIKSRVDKLEDDLNYCLNNFFKYNNDELFNILVDEKNFKFIENVGLVR